ncbi:MAG: hypothetical protein JSS22_11720 [Proteobacteria bacterium]|nr:hypothetical protein [Pseudomonadota bacterium]
MQLKSQHDDPHDAIAAQLRGLAPRVDRASPEPGIAPDRDLAIAQDAPAMSPASASESPLRATLATDNAHSIGGPKPSARSGHGVARLLLIVCTVIAAVIAWRSYGEEATQRLSELTPQLLTRTLATIQNNTGGEAPKDAAQTATPQLAAEPASPQEAATATPVQPSPATTTPAMESSPAQTTIPPELASSIESMTREIASLKQTVEELKAGQQQLAQDIAKAAEHETHRRPIAQTSKPTAPLRRQHASAPAAVPHARTPYVPPPNYSQQTYTQSAVQREATSPAPTQLPPQPGDTSAPRPPMPLR